MNCITFGVRCTLRCTVHCTAHWLKIVAICRLKWFSLFFRIRITIPAPRFRGPHRTALPAKYLLLEINDYTGNRKTAQSNMKMTGACRAQMRNRSHSHMCRPNGFLILNRCVHWVLSCYSIRFKNDKRSDGTIHTHGGREDTNKKILKTHIEENCNLQFMKEMNGSK